MKSLLDIRRRVRAHSCIGLALALCLLLPLAGFAQEAPPESETEQAEAEAEAEATEEAATEQEAGEVESAEEAGEETPAAEEEAVAADDDPAPDVEEIVVTGSRIRRDAFTAAMPVTVITAEGAALAGLTTAADVLQSSALASGTQIDNSFGGFVVSGGPGVNTFGLRSLGADRTLILVNGRRFTPAGTRGEVSSVDLNTIPGVAVQRYEILKDGASSIYGADAVAGVVNIITRKRFDDFVLEGNFTDQVDFRQASLIYGKTWDRGFFDFSLEYSERPPYRRAENTWSYCDQLPLTDGSIFPSIYAPSGSCFGALYNVVRVRATDHRRDASGSWVPITGAVPAPVGHRESRNWEEEHLLPELKLIQIYSDGEWDFDLDRVAWLGTLGDWLGAVTTDYEFYYTGRSFRQHGGHGQFFPLVSALNPTNPVNTINSAVAFSQPVVMAYDLRDPHISVKNNVTSIRAGASGDLGLYQWELEVGHSWSRGEESRDVILEDRAARALATVQGSDGAVRCPVNQAEMASFPVRHQLFFASNGDNGLVSRVVAEGPDPNCVPLDLFSREALAEGFIPQDAADYVTEYATGKTAYDLSTANFQVEGELFTLPAGIARGVVGLEWRRRELDDRPSRASVEDNLWGSTSAGRTTGRDRVSEAYTEVELPLLAGYALSGVSVAEELTLNLSWRYTDYSSYGSDDTYRLLLNYAPNPVFRVRTALGTSFRAPALYELNLENQTGFTPSRVDPCNNYRSGNLSTESNRYRNCDAQLAAIADASDDGDFFAGSSVLTISGGNRDLKAETSDSFTLGLIMTPDLAGLLPQFGVSISLAWDYYDIKVENAITRLGVGFTLTRCYDSENFSAQECALVGNVGADGQRQMRSSTDGQLISVNSSFINIAIEQTKGYDITLRMDREFPLGDLGVNILAARLLSYESLLAAGVDPDEYSGHHAYPDWRGEADIRFDLRDWTFSWTMNYIGSTDEEPTTFVASRSATNTHRADSKLYHAISVRYTDPKERFGFVAGIANLMDEDPPLVGWGSGESLTAAIAYNIPLGSAYDLIGRRFFASLTYSFY